MRLRAIYPYSLRDAWQAVRIIDSTRATHIAQNWFELPYPTFKRLALFAASQDSCIPPEKWVKWLLADGAWFLWSTDTGREVFRLFVLQGRHLTGATQECLETAILAGPPREMYRDDLEVGRWQDLVTHSVWLHLAKLNSSSCTLGALATARLTEISNAYPKWQLAANESDEFSHWMSSSADPDYESSREVDIAPRKRRDLVQWLAKPPREQSPFYEDTWRDVCRKHLLNSLCALSDLASRGEWPKERWREALQAWSDRGIVKHSWRYAAPIVKTMPDSVLQEIAHSATWWLESVSKSINRHQCIFIELCRRVLALPLEADSGSHLIRDGVEIYDPVGCAINHPIGHVTQAIMNLWFKESPGDNDLLPADIEPIFTSLCDEQVDRFRHGRVLLGSRLISLFRVDRPWTEQHLLPLFSWSSPIEAKAVWEGFLWSPRLYQPLLSAFKEQFLDSANHYADLGEHRQQFAAFLTYAALGQPDEYSVKELRFAFSVLPQEGLEESTQALTQALEGAAAQREEYWKNRVQPFWQEIWPKSRDLANPRISEHLAHLVIAARGEFPAAFNAVQDWLQPIEHPDYTIHLLHESDLCKRFPKEALLLLNALIASQQWIPRELGQCLDAIEQVAPQLARNTQYQRLREYFRRRGG